MDKYLIKYLRENAESEVSKKCIDFLKIEFDRQIYQFHFNAPDPNPPKQAWDKLNDKFETIQRYVSALQGLNYDTNNYKIVLSFIESPISPSLESLGFKPLSPIWNPVGQNQLIGDKETILWHRKVYRTIRAGNIGAYLDPSFHRLFLSIQERLFEHYSKLQIKALLLRSDIYPMSKFALDVFNQMNLPSFIFTHGLPAIYTQEIDNRSDYLCVWGGKMKMNYIDVGFDPEKIKVVGHPGYQNPAPQLNLRSDLSNVLVVPVSSSLSHQNEYDHTVLMDKSATVLYLYRVQKVLQNLGVKKARFRVHPSINRNWVYSCLDREFYSIDSLPLKKSLEESSLLIGATSTLFLEALIHGVNYLVYEPTDKDGLSMINTRLVPPFDGSDDKVRVAHDDAELEYLLKSKALTDYSIVPDYIQEFDITCLKELIP